jgi:DNA invertase Pin-like site-specific DNA recombinase
MTAQTSTDLTPAVGYLRLSDYRTEGALQGRAELLKARAAEWGWRLTDVDIITENDLAPRNGDGSPRGVSAFKRRKVKLPDGRVVLRVVRPGFQLLLARIAAGYNAIAEDLDRLLRQPRDGEELIDTVQLAGTTVRSLSGSVTLTAGGTDDERFVARVMAATANKASADIGRRVSAARGRLAGESYQGGRRPFGYVRDSKAPKYHKRLIVVEAEAGVIRQAAADILDLGISLKAVARDLRERPADRRVPTVTGTAWSAKTLREVLIKPSVAGLAVKDGKLVPADAIPEPVLDVGTWERLRDMLTDPARRTNTSRANEPRWLVSGFAECGVCHKPMRVGGGRDRAHAYIGKDCCHVRRNAKAVDAHIAELVVRRLSEPDAADLLRPPPRPAIDATRLRAERDKLLRQLDKQARMNMRGELSDRALKAGQREAAGLIAAIDAQLQVSDEPDPLPEFREGRPAGVVWAELGTPRRRAIVQTLIEAVVVNRAGRRGQGFDPETLDVTWAPGV